MPTYEYLCPEGHRFEQFQRITDEPRARCPACGVEASRILSGGAGFLFKGGGFYITDYRSEAYKKAAAREEKGGGEEGGAKAGKREEVAAGASSSGGSA